MTRKIFYSVLIIVCAVNLPGCRHPGGIVGKWRAASGENEMVWEFSEGGTVVQGSVRGRYSLGNNQRVKIETPFATVVYRFQLSGDHLILTDTNGASLQFTRWQNAH